jgi:hypothetical protein
LPTNAVRGKCITFKRLSQILSYLPPPNSRDDENEREGNHGEGDQDPNFQEVIGKWRLVGAIDDWERLRAE